MGKFKLAWNRESEVYLLELVKTNRCMWDPNDPDYPKTLVKKKACAAIAHSIAYAYPELQGLNASQVHQKFKNIRTYFVNLYKKMQRSSHSDDAFCPKWPLFEVALFLKDSSFDNPNASFGYEEEDDNRMGSHWLWETQEQARAFQLAASPSNSTSASSSARPNTPPPEEILAAAPYIRPDAAPYMRPDEDSDPPPPSRRPGLRPKRRKRSCNDKKVDNYIKRICEDMKTKQNRDPISASLGCIVEAAVEKMSYEKQISFSQKLLNLIAEASEASVERPEPLAAAENEESVEHDQPAENEQSVEHDQPVEHGQSIEHDQSVEHGQPIEHGQPVEHGQQPIEHGHPVEQGQPVDHV